MPGLVSLQTPIVTAEPGGMAVAELRVRNTGHIVDQYSFTVVGDTDAWTTVEPAVLSLFPGAEGSVNVVFRPPRSSEVVAGTIPYGVRVTSSEDADFSYVEEGSLQIGGFAQMQAKLVPRTSEGKRGAVHRVEVTNTGNAAVHAALSASDPDDLLLFYVTPAEVDVPPGATVAARVRVKARKTTSGRTSTRRPFQVTVEGPTATTLEGAFEQKPTVSILLILAIVVVAVVLALLLKDQAEAATLLLR